MQFIVALTWLQNFPFVMSSLACTDWPAWKFWPGADVRDALCLCLIFWEHQTFVINFDYMTVWALILSAECCGAFSTLSSESVMLFCSLQLMPKFLKKTCSKTDQEWFMRIHCTADIYFCSGLKKKPEWLQRPSAAMKQSMPPLVSFIEGSRGKLTWSPLMVVAMRRVHSSR